MGFKTELAVIGLVKGKEVLYWYEGSIFKPCVVLEVYDAVDTALGRNRAVALAEIESIKAGNGIHPHKTTFEQHYFQSK